MTFCHKATEGDRDELPTEKIDLLELSTGDSEGPVKLIYLGMKPIYHVEAHNIRFFVESTAMMWP